MISFLTWLEKKGINENDLYAKFDSQKTASVAQALASSGNNPNSDIIAKTVVNDPKLKQVTPKGVKPDEDSIRKDVVDSLKRKQEDLKKSQVAARTGRGAGI
jgi:hypothetical protein